MLFDEIKNNVYYCGIKDKDRKLFDELVALTQGTSYNSYLLVGSEKTALIDTTFPPKIDEYINNLEKNGIKHIDYIIANHGEQDHSGAIPALLQKYPEAMVVTNPKCKEIIMDMLEVPDSKFITVNDGEELSLGDKTLRFIYAPWVHWPDTMFTYIIEDKMLFTCDYLGAHYTNFDLYADNSKELEISAKRYYAEIMMPFRTFAKKYLDIINNLPIDILLPSHGPIYKDYKFIYDLYTDWTKDTTDNFVLIPFVSMYQSTYKMAKYLEEKLKEKGINVELFNVVDNDHGELAVHVVNATTIVLAAPMVLAGPHPEMVTTSYLLSALRPKFKHLAVIGSFGWGGNLVSKLEEMFALLKPEKLDSVLAKGSPKAEDYKKLDNLANQIEQKFKELNLLQA